MQEILAAAGREEDYIEFGLDGRWRWNPLLSEALDAYSLAYTISSLLNQLFGKGKEPFWQQVYTNLCRWIIETHKTLPGGWVTLQTSTGAPLTASAWRRRSAATVCANGPTQPTNPSATTTRMPVLVRAFMRSCPTVATSAPIAL